MQWKNLKILGNCLAFHMNILKNMLDLYKSCKPGMQITTSEDVEHLPRRAGSRVLLSLSLYFSGFLILWDNDKGTPAGICDGV